MGKSNKKLANRGDSVSRPDSLSTQLMSGGAVQKNRSKNQLRERKNEEAESATAKAQVVDEYLSEKILKQARKQQNELENGEISEKQRVKSRTISLRTGDNDASDDDESVNFDFGGAECYEPVVTEEEERVLAQFMTSSAAGGSSSTNQKRPNRLLADMIMEKIDEKRFELESRLSQSGGTESIAKKLDPRVIHMYKDVGRVLSTYRSGKLPKPFKIVPKLTDWEEILYLTEPEKWTAAAMYQATRIFVSNLNVKMCQRFLSLILLPRIRDDIAEYKKLNFHLYQALGKALFKPAAFFKAILLPLCQEGNCTLREAMIIGSLLTKCSVPSLHAAAAMLKIAEMDYSGANSLFLRVLIDKKYTLPYRVIDGLVSHFLRFINDDRNLPVLWHQSLLAFCQRYKSDLSSEQKDHLLELIRTHFHAQIGPEIRRELVHAQPRDLEDQQPIGDEHMSDVGDGDWSD